MGLRSRRSERQEERREFGVGGNAVRYQMRQKLISFGNDFWIENADGQRVFRVDGKALRMRSTMDLEDLDGNQLCRIQSRVLHIRDTMAIDRPDGSTMATVHKKLITPIRDKWEVNVDGGEDMSVRGNLVDHEYELEVDGRKIAEVSKRWFRVRDTYGIQIAPDADHLLVLATAVALDAMAHPGE
jgi:uncharacterized protein YxjI